MKIRNSIRKTALAIAIASVSIIANAQNVSLYESHVLPEALLFEPSSTIGMNSDIDIIVKGPDGLIIRQSFQAGEPIELNPAAILEGGLPDGAYRYELRITDLKGVSATRGAGGIANEVQDIPVPGFGSFAVLDGKLVSPDAEEAAYTKADSAASPATTIQPSASDRDEQTRDQVINDDLIVTGSICVGFDCVNGESFGFDTLRLKENNLRIKFDDTSTTGSFPNRDWQLTANDSANGGANKFSIDDITGGRTPFTIEAGAPSHSLYVDDGGRIGMGTMTPVVQAHMVDGNTPTLRLEQDGSSGFASLTWDIAGNEANFFIRDATNGSKLPFRIFPNAPSDSLIVEGTTGDIGMGTTSPDATLHVIGSSLFVEPTDGGERPNINALFRDTDSRVQLQLVTANSDWQIISEDDGSGNEGLSFTRAGTGTRELRITPAGGLIVAGTNLTVPDYVFEAEYDLMPLDQLGSFIDSYGHLPNVDSAATVKENGLNITGLSLKLLEKVEELTLYTLQQQNEIASLRAELKGLQGQLESSDLYATVWNNRLTGGALEAPLFYFSSTPSPTADQCPSDWLASKPQWASRSTSRIQSIWLVP